MQAYITASSVIVYLTFAELPFQYMHKEKSNEETVRNGQNYSAKWRQL